MVSLFDGYFICGGWALCVNALYRNLILTTILGLLVISIVLIA